jgi:UDP-N-acetylmuramate dehydrogenase
MSIPVAPTFSEAVPLAAYATLRVGGPARYFVAVTTARALEWTLAEARERDLPVFLLGGGSNLVVADAGFDGLVVRNALAGFLPEAGPNGKTWVTAGAGEDWDLFVDRCVAEGLQGVECLAGIPGTVGATPVQNVGAYGQEVADTVVRLTALDRTTGETVTLTRDDCRFAYRRSRFNAEEPGRWIITSVTFALHPGGVPCLKYRDIQQYFEGRAEPPTLAEVATATREIRARKGMVVREEDPDSRSAGSFFKNPTVPAAVYEAVAARYADGAVPHWPQPDGTVKLSAAWLIEQSGFRRGETFGNVGFSGKHILAIVNRGHGTAAEIIALARRVQERVGETFGVPLHPEPVFVGFAAEATLPEGATRAGGRSQ